MTFQVGDEVYGSISGSTFELRFIGRITEVISYTPNSQEFTVQLTVAQGPACYKKGDFVYFKESSRVKWKIEKVPSEAEVEGLLDEKELAKYYIDGKWVTSTDAARLVRMENPGCAYYGIFNLLSIKNYRLMQGHLSDEEYTFKFGTGKDWWLQLHDADDYYWDKFFATEDECYEAYRKLVANQPISWELLAEVFSN
jgi:hypothetical protein